jgi:uncharacterized protein (TIGR00369 family)
MSQTADDYLRDSLSAPPFHQWLKPEMVSADEENGVVVRLVLRFEFRRHPERPEIHGGVIASLIDIAGHAAIAAKLQHGVPTIDLRIDYLRMAAGRELRAAAALLKLGRTVGVVDVRVTDDQGKLVAAGRGTFSTRAG